MSSSVTRPSRASTPVCGRPRDRRPLPFRLVAMVGVVVAAVMTAVVPGAPVAAAEVRPIVHPVQRDHLGNVHWTDTYGAPRSGGRSHLGVDIMGPKMTPLVAAVDGTVSWMRHDSLRGNILDITDSDGWTYHYVHINNDTPGTDDGANAFEFAFAPGIARGTKVRAGELVAYLGDSGNAESTGAHLHFEISRPDGSPINPTPSVDAAAAWASQFPDVDPSLLGPYDSLSALVADVVASLTAQSSGSPTGLDLAHRVAQAGMANALVPFVDSSSRAAAIDRLYVAFFLRLPDFGGYEYWIDRDDLSLAAMADHFAESDEYRARYGDLPFGDFLDQLYIDVLHREPDIGGKEYWLARLADPGDPVTRGTIVSYFTDSTELRGLAAHRSEIVALIALLEDRMPTNAEIEAWNLLRADADLPTAIIQTFLS